MALDVMRNPPSVEVMVTWYRASQTTPFAVCGHIGPVLAKVLDAGNREAAATMSWQNARENFSDSSHERNAHERAMLAASDAGREAHVLLATLKRFGA